jgi:hypothetical protein
MLPPVLFLHLRRIGMAWIKDGLAERVVRGAALSQEEQAIPASRDSLFESGVSLMLPVFMVSGERAGT